MNVQTLSKSGAKRTVFWHFQPEKPEESMGNSVFRNLYVITFVIINMSLFANYGRLAKLSTTTSFKTHEARMCSCTELLISGPPTVHHGPIFNWLVPSFPLVVGPPVCSVHDADFQQCHRPPFRVGEVLHHRQATLSREARGTAQRSSTILPAAAGQEPHKMAEVSEVPLGSEDEADYGAHGA